MKKTVAIIVCVLVLLSLIASTLIFHTGKEANPSDEQNGGSAFIIWGTRDYANETYMGGENELNASRDVCDAIYESFAGTQYSSYSNFWGNDTQPDQVYGNVSYCEENYNFTAIFYKGHSIGAYCDYENCELGEHWTLYADRGYGSEYIQDYRIHESMSSGTHDFVFLWTCGYGSEARIGEIDENDHSVGMLASWMDTTSIEADGYASPDGSNHCFISFDNYSIWFTNKTGYGNFSYGDFASLFFEYALYDGWTINDALDATAEETHMQASFGDCKLYKGYLMPDPDNSGQLVMCYMRVWGDGNLKLKKGHQNADLPSLQSIKNSETEKVLEYLEDVIGLDVSRYDVELLGHSERYPDWLNGLTQANGKIALESETSKLDVLFKFRNNTLSWCLVRPIEGTHQNINLLPAGVHEAVDGFFERYQTYSKNSAIQQMRNMLNTIDLTENTTRTEENTKLSVSVNSFSTSFEFITTIDEIDKKISVSFRTDQFYAFSDDTIYN